MTFEWINLPEHLWITILQQLDLKSLLNASETCSTLNYLLCDPIFSTKLKLFIDHDLRRDKHLVNSFKHSNRKYRIVKFFFSHGDNKYPTKSSDFEVMLEILNRFSDSIREIEIRDIKISCTYWNRLIQSLKYVKTFVLSKMIFYRVTSIEKSVLKIDSLSMIHCDLRYMDIIDGANVNKVKLKSQFINQYELFLLKHEELKILTSDIWRMFVNDHLSNVKFSLEHLDLYFAEWYNKQHALNFIRTQTKLQTVILNLNMHQYDILFLKHIINNNPNLKILYIQLYGDYTSFNNGLGQIDINLSVTHFVCDCSRPNIKLSEKMNSLFPNNIVKKKLKFDQFMKLIEKNKNTEF